jgi:hypothetical protein
MEDYFSARQPSASSAAAEDARPRHRRLLAPDLRRVPQLRVHQDQEGVPVPGPAGDARRSGAPGRWRSRSSSSSSTST